MTDAVGFRVVCSNIEDVSRIVDAIRGSDRFQFPADASQDFIKHPQESGYRALHLAALYELPNATQTKVRCEIQIRTLAQDTWARLAHDDLYNHGHDVPAHIVKLGTRLAALFAVADDIAQDIREEASRPLVGAEAPDDVLTPEGLAFIYQRAFGELPQDFVIRWAVQKCIESECHRLDLLDRVLRSERDRQTVGDRYRAGAGWPMDNDTWLSLAIDVAVTDLVTAATIAEARGEAERREIEAVARRDFEFDMPQTLDDFKQIFAAYRKAYVEVGSVYDAAAALNAITYCNLCTAPIVEVDAMVEEALGHYGLEEDTDEELADLIHHCGVEVSDWSNKGLCSYHAYVMSKDD